jgi:hypothetical protein
MGEIYPPLGSFLIAFSGKMSISVSGVVYGRILVAEVASLPVYSQLHHELRLY